MKEYVAGFFFDTQLERVVLIEKQRPNWQKGFYNGIGGHIEPDDEYPEDAMEREFLEETGHLVEKWKWHLFCVYHNDEFMVHFFMAIGDVHAVQTTTDERVERHWIDHLPSNVIPNLLWLIPLAIQSQDSDIFADVQAPLIGDG